MYLLLLLYIYDILFIHKIYIIWYINTVISYLLIIYLCILYHNVIIHVINYIYNKIITTITETMYLSIISRMLLYMYYVVSFHIIYIYNMTVMILGVSYWLSMSYSFNIRSNMTRLLLTSTNNLLHSTCAIDVIDILWHCSVQWTNFNIVYL